MIDVRILRVGRTSALLELAGGDEVEAWRAELWRRRDAGDLSATDIVTGARTVLVDGCADIETVIDAMRGWTPRAGSDSTPGEHVTIPIRYDGEDLEWVAAHLERSLDAFVAWHLDTEFRVAFCGFAPGFAYMTGLDVSVPRLSTPRPRVRSGSVGLADTYCGIYPTSSPGGWRLIGTTDAVLFDPDRAAPALLTPGTRVRFTRVGR
jgi:KipI family sensor histidine kinase inhibitor